MKKIAFYLFCLTMIVSCGNQHNAPDVSKINVSISTDRFDEDFFAIDTTAIESGIARLENKYPTLLPIYLRNILGTGDSMMIRSFLRLNRGVYEDVQKKYPEFSEEQSAIQQAYQFVKYYFPEYHTPAKIRTIVGPIDAMASMRNGDLTPDFLAPDFAGISLQFYLGKNYEVYQQEFFINNIAPQYRSARFDKQYITADLMKLVADDIYPDSSRGKPLIEQIIEKGKQWYLLQHFLPNEPDSLFTGFSGKQLAWCTDNEGLIWNRLMSENLYGIDPEMIQTYIGEAPFTMNMPTQSPGNIGQWVGWQIVKKYAAQTDEPWQR